MCQHCDMLKAAEDDLASARASHPHTLDYIGETVKANAWIARAEEYLDRVERCKCDCSHGVFYGHGYVLNGVFKGYTGTCFRCGGKGYQNNGDRRRNWGYDNNRVISIG